ncbi:small multidrug resistance pump [Microbacterium foliorum]|uniref:Small multidrug resistance pump n=1 Tax=Microbacterium foliorum TaxID=104336 RepID=A0ABU1HVL3_9MICO|nr:SMR family transporter [Microbacterium foliorum]MDR6144097.1 small multidrug resistance pump [Microbacterium foliorum]
MKKWSALGVAIIAEVAGAMSLKVALQQPWWFALTIAGYVTAFALMAWLLRDGNALGVIYGIWAACGVALTAIAGAVIYGDALSWASIIGIAVVILGVVLVESGHTQPEAAA